MAAGGWQDAFSLAQDDLDAVGSVLDKQSFEFDTEPGQISELDAFLLAQLTLGSGSSSGSGHRQP
jgi:hypothetical protein